MEPVTYELACKLVKWYGCSACYSGLEKHPAEDAPPFWVVKCTRCGDDTRGFVSMKTIERRRSESVGEKREVEKMLIRNGYLPDPLAGKSAEQLLKELGY